MDRARAPHGGNSPHSSPDCHRRRRKGLFPQCPQCASCDCRSAPQTARLRQVSWRHRQIPGGSARQNPPHPPAAAHQLSCPSLQSAWHRLQRQSRSIEWRAWRRFPGCARRLATDKPAQLAPLRAKQGIDGHECAARVPGGSLPWLADSSGKLPPAWRRKAGWRCQTAQRETQAA